MSHPHRAGFRALPSKLSAQIAPAGIAGWDPLNVGGVGVGTGVGTGVAGTGVGTGVAGIGVETGVTGRGVTTGVGVTTLVGAALACDVDGATDGSLGATDGSLGATAGGELGNAGDGLGVVGSSTTSNGALASAVTSLAVASVFLRAPDLPGAATCTTDTVWRPSFVAGTLKRRIVVPFPAPDVFAAGIPFASPSHFS